MRTRLIAGLVSLSLASGYESRAQDALWFTPSPPTVSASEPTPGELSFAKRFGGLLSKPGGQVNVAAPAAVQTADNQQPASSTAPQRELGTTNRQPAAAGDLRIPWSLTATTPFPLEPTTKTATHATANSGRAAQVRATAPQVKPTYVQPPALSSAPAVAQPQSPQLSRTPATTVPWQNQSTQPSCTSATPVAVATSVPPLPDLPAPQPPALQLDSLIQPVPVAKLTPHVPRVEVPQAAAALPTEKEKLLPTEKLSDKTLVSPPLQVAVPAAMVLIDNQQSASDRGSQTIVPEPAVTNRLTDRPEVQPLVAPLSAPQELARRPTANETPLLTTESMIGPLKSAESLFERLELQNDLRHVASLIDSGPRGDASNFAWMPAAYTWISPAFYHHPLYFEQPNLERYGVGTRRALQPLASSIHFFGSIPLVPYKTLTHHPRERVYTLGNLRPGNCVPVQRGVILGQSTVGEVTMFWEECSGY